MRSGSLDYASLVPTPGGWQRPTLTICAVDDVTPGLAADAIRRSCQKMRFDRALLLSSRRPPGLPDGIEHVAIAPIASRDDYSNFMLRDVAAYIQTSHVLVVQWDGYILDAAAWETSFTSYDYIGAVWSWHPHRKMGNGGFSLRSRRLLQAVARIAPEQLNGLGEDEIICRVLADRLEDEFGLRFAPEPVAHRFAYERSVPECSTFGFHGLFNLGRHLGDEELQHIVRELPPNTILNREFVEFIAQCLTMKRFAVVRACFQRLSTCKEQAARAVAVDSFQDATIVAPDAARSLLAG